MRVIAHILSIDRIDAVHRGKWHAAPWVQLLTAFVCILLCALTRNMFFVYCILAVLLMELALLPAQEIPGVLRPVLTAALFTMLIMLPAVFLGQPKSMLTVSFKVCEAVLVLSLLNRRLSWKEVTGALGALHVPGIFLLTLDTAVRFLVILGRYAQQMLEAVSLRRVGEKNWRNAGTGGVLGTTFLKSQQMAQQTSEAMACRCFNGEYGRRSRWKMKKADILHLLLIPAMILLFVIVR